MKRFLLPLFLLAACAAPQGPDLSGKYLVEGTSADGSHYSGVAVIKRVPATYQMTWEIGSTPYKGMGGLENDRLVIDWGSDAPVIYTPQPNGTLDGTWAKGEATETLTPLKR